MRKSTWVLIVVFVAALVAYVMVKPAHGEPTPKATHTTAATPHATPSTSSSP